MQPPPEPAPAVPVIALPAHANTMAAEELHERLVGALDHGGVHVDASGNESIGQAVLQVLIAARADARDANRDFRIINPTPAFVERIGKCHLADAVGLPANADAIGPTSTVGDEA